MEKTSFSHLNAIVHPEIIILSSFQTRRTFLFFMERNHANFLYLELYTDQPQH